MDEEYQIDDQDSSDGTVSVKGKSFKQTYLELTGKKDWGKPGELISDVMNEVFELLPVYLEVKLRNGEDFTIAEIRDQLERDNLWNR